MIIAGTFDAYAWKAPVATELGTRITPVEHEAAGRRFRMIPGVRSGSPTAYLNLTDVHGEVGLVLRYADLTDNSILLEVEIRVNCEDPLQSIELAIPLPELPIPHPGVYAIELLYGNEWLGSHRVRVISLEGKENKE